MVTPSRSTNILTWSASTPDGRYAIANGLYWGADVQGTWNEAPPRGTVVSVKLDAGKAADGSPRHALVSHAQTGVSPEGLVVSPDGIDGGYHQSRTQLSAL